MGSRVNVCSVNFKNNCCNFEKEFELDITFEVFEPLPYDLEWKLVYVGSGKSREFDQELDSCVIGPTPEGKHKFEFITPPPNPEKIPAEDVIGASVLLLKVLYDGNEFLSLGWWVANEYVEESMRENPPALPDFTAIRRTIKEDDVRITTYPITWFDGQVEEQPPAVEEENIDEADLMPLQDDDEKEDEAVEDEVDEDAEDVDVDLDTLMVKDGDKLAESDAMDDSGSRDSEVKSTEPESIANEAGDAPMAI